MNPALEKLSKYLRLEAQRGFDNRAVLGGLARILDSWKEEARDSGLAPTVIEAVTTRLRDYQRLSTSSRRVVLEGLWNRLQSEFPDLAEAPSPFGAGAQPPVDEPEPSKLPAAPAHEQPEQIIEDVPTVSPQVAPKEAEEDAPPKPEPPAALDAPLTTIQGIGPKSAKTLAKLGLETLGDLLWHLPRRYDDYSQLKTINRLWYGEEVTIIGTVEEINLRTVRSGRMKLVEATVSDGTGSLRITWFNQAWIANRLKVGRPVVLSGKIDQYLGRLVMNNPEWEPLNRQQLHTNRIVPVYPLTAGITAKWIRRVMSSVVGRLAARIPDPLPTPVRESAELIDLPTALQQVHFPDDQEALEAARTRLAFDEMFLLQLGVLGQKANWEDIRARPLAVEDSWMGRFLEALPFTLTSAQQRALEDLRADLAAERPMNRLLEGDVGSGKTVLAAAGIGIAAENGAQSAFMAPTSILAEQHYQTLLALLPAAAGIEPQSIRLLIGATSEPEKQAIRDGLQRGDIKVVIGTHALLEDPVQFDDFGLAIIDEQHRFGVDQRARLREKGDHPNLLVMTATPIPRSLALTIFGDLDLSVVDELPPGRQPIETRVLSPSERSRAYSFIENQIEAGRQAFIIYPLVESSEKIEARAAVEEQERLQKEVFFRYQLGLLHGRMNQEEKDAVMARFRDGEYDVLVSTSVVEVGMDVPNATVMLIDGADRFGLSQLHQFRGRVGRGSQKSYCMLIPQSEEGLENERLKAMEETSDGFELAELDLQQRGPGDFFGTRQSGFAELKMAAWTDVRLIERARREAQRLFSEDPELERKDHLLLRDAVSRFWRNGKGDMS